MEVPADYVINMMRQVIDAKIEALEKKLEAHHLDLKSEILDLKTALKEFQNKCQTDMNHFDTRIKDNEQFKWKVIAYSGVIAAVVGVILKCIF